MARNKLKRLLDQVIDKVIQETDGYVNFEQFEIILEQIGVSKAK